MPRKPQAARPKPKLSPFEREERAKARSKPKPKPKPAASAKQEQSSDSTPLLAYGTQLRLLDVFSRAFADELYAPDLDATLQEIKGALFNRDFAAAFGREENLAAYAARWSPTRALCYASIFNRLEEQFSGLLTGAGEEKVEEQLGDGDGDAERPRLRMVSVGGGAAEVGAMATFLECNPHASGDLTLVDSGPWGPVVDRLQHSLTTAPPLPSTASPAAVAANKPFLPTSALKSTFHHDDILSLDGPSLSRLLGDTPAVVTLLFTLNELFTSAGIGKTTAFLLALGAHLAKDSLLLVVDSPGSYAEAQVGGGEKRYPMRWLLEHALLTTAAGTWERVESCDSVWFRIAESLRYPLALENMRYQLHLYRVVRAPKPADEEQEA